MVTSGEWLSVVMIYQVNMVNMKLEQVNRTRFTVTLKGRREWTKSKRKIVSVFLLKSIILPML